MRRIDRWVGRPLCFLLSRFAKPRDGEHPAPRKILFVLLAELGALVLTHPAAEEARRRFPDAELHFLTFSSGRQVLELMGFPADRIHDIRSGGWRQFVGDTLSVLLRLRRLGIDTSVNFEGYGRFSTIAAFLSGARWRAGFHRFHEEGHYLGELVTNRVVYSPHRHAAASYLSLVSALAAPVGREPAAKMAVPDVRAGRFRFAPTTRELARVRDMLRTAGAAPQPGRRLIVLNANASDLVAQRRWPIERYGDLARALLRDPRVTVILSGSVNERERTERLAEEIGHDRVVNLAGMTSLRELLHLFCLADALVTNDSGPAHFASATDIPTVVLFGPETPRIFGPLGDNQRAIWLDLACSPCVSVYNQKRSVCSDNRCMKEITVDDVARALSAAMAVPLQRVAT